MLIHYVAANSQSFSAWVVSFRHITHNNVSVCHILPAIDGGLVLIDEEDGVDALDLSRRAPGEASNFVAIQFHSHFTVFWVSD